MNRNAFLTGILAATLVFGLTVMGCDNATPETTGDATWTVTFDAEGGTVTPTSTTVTKGAYLGSLPAPEKTGQFFLGWYTAAGGGGTPFTAFTLVTADITIHAKWGDTAPEYWAITFNANGGTVTPTSTSVIRGEAAGDLPVPTRSGSTFGGWYPAADGSGTRFTATTTVTADITVYAKWTAGSNGNDEPNYDGVPDVLPSNWETLDYAGWEAWADGLDTTNMTEEVEQSLIAFIAEHFEEMNEDGQQFWSEMGIGEMAFPFILSQDGTSLKINICGRGNGIAAFLPSDTQCDTWILQDDTNRGTFPVGKWVKENEFILFTAETVTLHWYDGDEQTGSYSIDNTTISITWEY